MEGDVEKKVVFSKAIFLDKVSCFKRSFFQIMNFVLSIRQCWNN